MKKMFLLLPICLGFTGLARADPPTREQGSRVDPSVRRSTFIASRANPDVSNTSISSGTIRLTEVFVSSPGVNSQLNIYANQLAGTTSNQIDAVLTNTYGAILYGGGSGITLFSVLGSTYPTGMVVTSTCTICVAGSSWTMPSLRIDYERVR